MIRQVELLKQIEDDLVGINPISHRNGVCITRGLTAVRELRKLIEAAPTPRTARPIHCGKCAYEFVIADLMMRGHARNLETAILQKMMSAEHALDAIEHNDLVIVPESH